MNIHQAIALWKQTDNSAHARWIADEVAKAIDRSGFKKIEKQLDVTVGHASGGEVKSGLLWAVIDLVEAKNKRVIAELEAAKSKIRLMQMSENTEFLNARLTEHRAEYKNAINANQQGIAAFHANEINNIKALIKYHGAEDESPAQENESL